MGALAVALGVGFAVATGQGAGLAVADDATTSGDGPSDNSPRAGQQAGTGAETADAPPGQQEQATDAEPGVQTDPDGGIATEFDGDQELDAQLDEELTDGDAGEQEEEINDAGAGEVQAGTQLEVDDTGEEPVALPEPEAEQPPAEPVEAQSGGDTLASQQPVTPAPAADPAFTVDPADPPAVADGAPVDDELQLSSEPMLLIAATHNAPQAARITADAPTGDAIVATSTDRVGPIAALLAIPASLAVAVVDLVAGFFEPIIGPGAPLDSPLLWGVLAWAQRQTRSALGNRSPQIGQDSISLTVDENSGATPIAALPATDADGDTLTYTVDNGPSHGSVTIDGNTVTYTPATDYAGTDTFTLIASDRRSALHLHAPGQTHTDTATVTVTVVAGNQNPVASDDTATVGEDATVTIAVLDNDNDADGDTLSLASVGPTANGGTAVIDGDAIVYTPNPTTQALGAGQQATDTFSYQISDGHGGTATATVSVTVIGANDAAVITGDTTGAVSETGTNNGTGFVITAVGSGADFGSSMTLQPDGKILVAGTSYNDTTGYDFALIRYNTDGTLDDTFAGNGTLTTDLGSNDYANGVSLQPDGKILVAGYSDTTTGIDFAVVRYNTDGTLDTTFAGNGTLTTDLGSNEDYANSVTVQPDGKILVAGNSTNNATGTDIALIRYNTDGTLDDTFADDGILTTDLGSDDYGTSVTVQPDGKILVAGTSSNDATGADIALVRYNTDGTLDTTFAGNGTLTTDLGSNGGYGVSVTVQPDGKILVAGISTNNATGADIALVRYNTDGTLDTTFAGNGTLTTDLGANDYSTSVTVQPDGKILVAGYSYNADADIALVRYNTDGTLDTTFAANGTFTTDLGSYDFAHSVTIQPDRKILVAGYSYNFNSTTGAGFAVVRYNTDGTLDTSFGITPGTPTATGDLDSTDVDNPDDTWIPAAATTATGYGSYTINTNGTWTYTLDDTNPTVDALNTTSTPLIDTFTATTTDGTTQHVTITITGANDAAVITGDTTGAVSETSSNNGSGFVTTAVGPSQDLVSSVAVQPDGKIVVAGYSSQVDTEDDFAVVRYNADGTLDTTFAGNGTLTTDLGSDDRANSVTLQPDGKILVAGYSFNFNSTTGADIALVRYNTDGTLDTTFAGDGTLTTDLGSNDDLATSVSVQDDGKILVAGYSYTSAGSDFALVRYNTDGTLDTTFAGDGTLTTDLGTYDFGLSVTVQDDGKILVAGSSYTTTGFDFALVRYNADGTLDTSFAGDGILTTDLGSTADNGLSVTVQDDGRILVTGSSDQGTTGADVALVRYNTDGTLDTTFAGNGILTTDLGTTGDSGYGVTVQPDGKIVVAGRSGDYPTGFDVAVMRYNTDGTLDDTFAGNGTLTTDLGTYYDGSSSVAVQPDGKIIAAGHTYGSTTSFDFAVVRYNTDGTLDTSFGITPGTPTATGDLDSTDVDNPDDTWIPAAAVTATGYGSYTINTNGTWTYTLDDTNPTVDALNTTSTPLIDTFTATTTDGTAQHVTITITGVDDGLVSTAFGTGADSGYGVTV